MTAQQLSDEFKTSPLATKIIAGMCAVLVTIFGWWCFRVTTQLDLLIASNNAKTVEQHSVYLQMLFDEQNKIKETNASNNSIIVGLVKDMDIVKARLFK